MSPRVPRQRDPSPAEVAARRAVMARDAGLRKIGDVTRWLTAAVIALSGALALIAANAFHGHATTSTNVSSPVTQSAANSDNGLQSPQQVPSQVQQQPVVVSGGS